MGILEKLGLVEDDGQEPQGQYEIPAEPVVTPEPVAAEPSVLDDATESELQSVVSVYEKAGLADLSKSIYKVEELKNALPGSLDLQTIKQSVLGVMKVAGLGVEEVLTDSDRRVRVLQEAQAKQSNDIQAEITANLTEIEALEARVNELKQINNQKKKLQEEQTVAMQGELEKIQAIVKFIS